MPSETIALETLRELASLDPDHHLWRNGRLYWVAFTIHLPPWQKERVRLSLGTANRDEARRRRDALLASYPGRRDCALSLRVTPADRRRREHGRRAAASRSSSVAA